ncbi:MAG: InlB B-repeat-containing protein [Clostridiales bacterium]|nr:InlB B-repeat-containing protein [Candidatus Scatonaster coprocaballi]
MAKFNIEATGDGLVYQWQMQKGNGGWTNSTLSSASTATLKVSLTETRIGYKYRCVITDKYGNSAESDAALLTIETEPGDINIVTQPQDFVGNLGDMAKFSVVAAGDGLVYQWQMQKGNGVWTNSTLSSASTATLKVSLTETRIGYKYRCVITDKCGNSVESDAALLTIETKPGDITVVTQPQDFVGNLGDMAKFNVVAFGDELVYQWQMQKGNGGWTNSTLSSASTSTLKVSLTENRIGYKYRCVITDKHGNRVESDAALLAIETEPVDLAILTQPQDFVGNLGDMAKFSVVAEGDDLVYQWQMLKESGKWTNSTLSSAGTATLKVSLTESRVGNTYRCVITDKYGNRMESESVLLDVLESCQVTWNANGGHFEEGEELEVSIPVGSWIGEYGFFAPERSGYVVDGWYKDPACTEAVDLDTYIVNENVTIYAHWIEAVTLTWNANGGAFYIEEGVASSVYTQDVPLNEVVINMGQDGIPERPGYAFAGWYSDQACTKAVYLDYYVALYDDTFYAKWVPGCQVTWNANGGSFFGLEDLVTITEILPKNEGVSSYYTPELNDKVFVGWYFDAKCQNAVDIENYTLTSNVTFYAKWADPVEITWDANGGYLDGDLNNTLWIDVVAKDEVCERYYCPERENHTFEGWCLDPECTTTVDLDTYIVTEDVTFYAKWNNSVTITWNSNGGYSEVSGSSILVEQFPKGQELQSWAGFEKDNLILEGWYLDQALTKRLPTNYVLNQDVTLYAKWAEPVTITWEANGGYLLGDPDLDSYKEILPKGQEIAEPPTIERDGGVFDGWYLDQAFTKRVDIYDYAPSQDTVFYAKWKVGITITFDANGGVMPSTGTSIETMNVVANTKLNMSPYPTHDEYMFECWCLDPECTLTVDDVREYVPSGNTTFYAKWNKSVYITLDANGGIVASNSQPTHTIQLTAGDVIPYIPATRVNDVFEGWYYDLGFTQPVPTGALIYEDTTIYAKWSSSAAQVACEDIEIQLILHGNLITGVSVEPDATQAEFGLYSDAACTKLIATTSISGTTTIEGVPVYTAKIDGSKLSPETTYYIKQTKGVSGFSVDQVVIKVTFDSEGEATYTNETLGITIVAAQFSNKFDLNQPPAISG